MAYDPLQDVEFQSRDELETELRAMSRAARLLSRSDLALIDRVFCDSRAGATYTVTVRWAIPTPEAQRLGARLSDAFLTTSKGHSGIEIQGPTGRSLASVDAVRSASG